MCAYLLGSRVQSWCDGYLILCARGNMKGPLSNNGHVEVMDHGHFEAFAAFVVVAIVVTFDVKQNTKAIILACLGT